MITHYPEWMTPLIQVPTGSLSVDFKEDLHRYALSKSDKIGLVYDSDGYIDILETNASFHLFFMVGKLKKRIIDKSSVFLRQMIKHRLEAEGLRSYEPKQPIFSLDEFCALVITVRLFEAISGRNLFTECGYTPQKLVNQYLHLFRKPDKLFSDSEQTGESSLVKTAQAVMILHSVGSRPDQFDSNLTKLILERMETLRLPRGGYGDRTSEPVASLAPTVSGLCLSRSLSDGRDHSPSDPLFYVKTGEFVNRLQTETGGFRADGLSPSPDLKHTFLAILTFGMLNDYQYTRIPERDKILNYINSLEQRDGGFAPDQWKKTSTVRSTFIALVAKQLLGDSEILS